MGKKVILSFCITLVYFQLFNYCYAQAPKSFKYQAVARDNSGAVLGNHIINFKISILKGSATGTTVYVETLKDTTNQFGLANLIIGSGVLVSGSFVNINWGGDIYFIKTEMDINAGTNFQLMGTSQLLSVPYALFAEKTGNDGIWIKDNNQVFLSDTSDFVGIGTINPLSNLHVFGCIRTEGTGGLGNRIVFNSSATGGHIYEWYGDNPAPGDITLYDRTAHARRLIIDSTGKLGVGISTPVEKLHVNGCIRTEGTGGLGNRVVFESTATGGHQYEWYGDVPSVGCISLYDRTAGSRRIVVDEIGNVGIGTSSPSYKLSVNGTIQAKEIIVQTGWSDFVFAKDYKLMNLKELEKYIHTNKHLPDIPSAKEVEDNGAAIGSISSKLLQKIEELTLYIIEQDKRIEKLEKDNQTLKNSIKK